MPARSCCKDTWLCLEKNSTLQGEERLECLGRGGGDDKCLPLVNGGVEIVGAGGDGDDLSNASAQQGDDGDDADKPLHYAAACQLPHNIKVLCGPLLMAACPCARSNLHARIDDLNIR